jgi:hypothetical protein
MHQAFAPALDQDEAVKGIDGDAVGLLEDRGEREAMAEPIVLHGAARSRGQRLLPPVKAKIFATLFCSE